jgi:Do/DeqQ family serine protease
MLFRFKMNSKKFMVFGLLAAALFLGQGSAVFSESQPVVVSQGLYDMQESFRQIAKSVLPSVVEVLTTSNQDVAPQIPFPQFPFFDSPFDTPTQPDQKAPKPTQKVQGLGSGVMIRHGGSKVYILTNNHVVDKAEKIQVTLNDGRKFDAKLVGADARRDLALISITANDKDIVLAKLGDSSQLQVGDLVMAIGNPLGLDFTVTHGIVSALGRRGGPDGSNFDTYIQTDAPINRGNSGGALVNLNGEIIGINTWIASPNGASVGLGFAIPINTAKKAIDDFITHGAVRYGWLGVAASGISDGDAKSLGLPSTQGAFVANIFKDSPADKAGIQPGDVVTGINGQDVKDPNDLVQIVGDLVVGQSVDFHVLRQGQKIDTTVTIQERVKESEISKLRTWPGLSVAEITPEIRDQLSLDNGVQGLVVAQIDSSSTAQVAGIQPQDVITKINDQPVRTLGDFYRQFNAKKGEVKISFVRQGVELSIGISH